MSKTIKSIPKVKSLLPQAVQERDQLLKMVVDKLYKDLGRNNMTNHYIIEEIAKSYFEKQKITDQGLRAMRNQVVNALKSSKNYSKISANRSLLENSLILNKESNQFSDNLSMKSGTSQKSNLRQSLPLIRNNNIQSRSSNKTKSSMKSQHKNDDIDSDTSSVYAREVYYVDGNDQTEWANLVKYDSQLYKKQLELTKLRQNQFKKKMKLELDQQIKEKKERQQKVNNQNQAYGTLQAEIYQNFVKQQNQKNKQRQQRLALQKKMRDMQIKQVNKRKKNEIKRQNQFDRQMVSKIQQEIAQQHQQNQQRKLKQKQRQKLMQQQSVINEQNKRRQRKQQRQQQIRQQNQYNQIQQQLENQKQRQRKQREDKIKQIMLSFANTVGKQQKHRKEQQDAKMMDYINKQLRRKQKQEQIKKNRQEQQKKQLKQFFDHQIEEKKLKKQNEESINKLQADIWRQDYQNFKAHESQRIEYMNEIKKRHKQILDMQVEEKGMKNGKSTKTAQIKI